MGKTLLLSIVLIGLLSAAGCQYYKVHDPASGKTYITNDWIAGRYTYSGAVRFHDLKTDRDVTLPASEVEKIPSDEATAEIAASRGTRK